MKKLCVVLLVSCFSITLLSAQTSTDSQAIPSQPGIYYQSVAGFVRIERVDSSGFKSGGKMKAAFTYGISKVNVSFTYPGSAANTRLSAKPTFLHVSSEEVSPNEIALLKMKREKNERKVECARAGAWSGTQLGNTKDAVPLTITRTPAGHLIITPAGELPPGEYLLTIATYGARGYEFGVD